MYLHDELIAQGITREEYRQRMQAARQERLQARPTPGASRMGGATPGLEGDFWMLVDGFVAQGLRRGAAIRRAAVERPDLHQRWLESRSNA